MVSIFTIRIQMLLITLAAVLSAVSLISCKKLEVYTTDGKSGDLIENGNETQSQEGICAIVYLENRIVMTGHNQKWFSIEPRKRKNGNYKPGQLFDTAYTSEVFNSDKTSHYKLSGSAIPEISFGQALEMKVLFDVHKWPALTLTNPYFNLSMEGRFLPQDKDPYQAYQVKWSQSISDKSCGYIYYYILKYGNENKLGKNSGTDVEIEAVKSLNVIELVAKDQGLSSEEVTQSFYGRQILNEQMRLARQFVLSLTQAKDLRSLSKISEPNGLMPSVSQEIHSSVREELFKRFSENQK